MTAADHKARLAQLRTSLDRVGADFVERLHELEPVAEQLSALEGDYRATLTMLGSPSRGRDFTEMAAEAALGRLRGLQPHLNYVSTGAMEEAERILLGRKGTTI